MTFIWGRVPLPLNPLEEMLKSNAHCKYNTHDVKITLQKLVPVRRSNENAGKEGIENDSTASDGTGDDGAKVLSTVIYILE